MKDVMGSPGTVSGLLLRIGQCAFAAASIGVMASAIGFSTFTAFWKYFEVGSCRLSKMTRGLVALSSETLNYLIASMGLQLLWSLGLACLDVYALRRKRDLQNPVLVSLFVVGDWVTSMLSLAAACSSAGVAVLYAKDLPVCRQQLHLPCGRFEISILLAFTTWILIAISSHVMFWIVASV
ncbi:CASP-like protein 5B2 isoform X1 [Tripterygium wilfordii]|uniref:CASP-like protein 5B2 isoform X1 n=1 Tax=Tripterygium wilfordii TaxID=458696 RepID=UPI0018F7E897|nr:CASP-like protein 5B2 isoform X1 [Tripterygium wilfordii]